MSADPSAPIEAGDHRLLDLEGVHQIDRVDGQRGLLAVADGVSCKEPRRPIAAQIGNDDAIPGLREQGRDIGEAMDVVRPAMQEKDDGSIALARIDIGEVQRASVDCPQKNNLVCSGSGQGAGDFSCAQPGLALMKGSAARKSAAAPMKRRRCWSTGSVNFEAGKGAPLHFGSITSAPSPRRPRQRHYIPDDNAPSAIV